MQLALVILSIVVTIMLALIGWGIASFRSEQEARSMGDKYLHQRIDAEVEKRAQSELKISEKIGDLVTRDDQRADMAELKDMLKEIRGQLAALKG